MSNFLLDRTTSKVLEDVLEQYFRPTGDLAEFKKKFPGTAHPPAELGRCIDYYCAVNAQHCHNYYRVRSAVSDRLHTAIVRTENDGSRYAVMSTDDAITLWINGSGADEERIRRVFWYAINYTEADDANS